MSEAAVLADTLEVRTPGPGLQDITGSVVAFVSRSMVRVGTCSLLVLHTSASLLVQENADPGVQRDLQAFLRRLVPEGDPLYEHVAEGPDDMPAHVKSALLPVSLTLPIDAGRLVLGTWQGVYLWEHRTRGHRRRISMVAQGIT